MRENFKEIVRFKKGHKNEKGLDQLFSKYSQKIPGGPGDPFKKSAR